MYSHVNKFVSMEANEALMPYSRKNVVGEGGKVISLDLEVLTKLGTNSRFEKVVYCKAIRRLSAHFGINVGDREITALSMLEMWCIINLREGVGGPWESIVEWTGYTRNWQAYVNSGIRDCIKAGFIEQVAVRGGTRIVITFQGMRALEIFEQMMQKVKEEIVDKYKLNKIDHENRIRARKS